jgi:hypothetical protein
MGSGKPLSKYAKIVLVFERREDGGLRVYSDEVPGLVLSGSDPDAVLADVKPALEGILWSIHQAQVTAEMVGDARAELESAGILAPRAPGAVPHVERVTQSYLALVG